MTAACIFVYSLIRYLQILDIETIYRGSLCRCTESVGRNTSIFILPTARLIICTKVAAWTYSGYNFNVACLSINYLSTIITLTFNQRLTKFSAYPGFVRAVINIGHSTYLRSRILHAPLCVCTILPELCLCKNVYDCDIEKYVKECRKLDPDEVAFDF